LNKETARTSRITDINAPKHVVNRRGLARATFYLAILCLFFFGMLKLSNILQLKNYGFLVFNYIPIIFFMTLTVSNNFVFSLSIK
jgi:hypothetical protein